ncbi:hypothetical protein A3Q56_00903 [Intoshia linei]|uniref:Nicastrin n=1 Tax=Intoshia linei TaxID=1819745 RepID=A0A177BAY4_9BILA|nr:hypothetical protein A3Q56_00903 [Intoshia linei]
MIIFQILLIVKYIHGYNKKLSGNLPITEYTIPSTAYYPCITRNGIKIFGCTSDYGGNSGIVNFLLPRSEYTWEDEFHTNVINNNENVVYFINADMINEKTFNFIFLKPDKIAGIVFYDDTGKYNHWNDTLFRKYMYDYSKIPIIYLKDVTTLKFIKEECYEKYNANDNMVRKCKANLRTSMTSQAPVMKCLNRSDDNFSSAIFQSPVRCNLLGGKSVHYMTESDEPISYLFQIPIDGFSMFDGFAPSITTTVVPLALFLNFMNSLNMKDLKKEIIFSLFGGETMNSIGSTRMNLDLKDKTFPRMFKVSKTAKYYNFKYYNILYDFNATLQENCLNYFDQMEQYKTDSKAKNTGLLACHQKEFVENEFLFTSIFDTIKNFERNCKVNKTDVNEAIDSHTKKIIQFIFGYEKVKLFDSKRKFDPNEFINCVAVNSNCTLFNAVISDHEKIQLSGPMDLYVGINENENMFTFMVKRLVDYITGENVPNVNITECHNMTTKNYTYIWMNGYKKEGLCIKSSAFYSKAMLENATDDKVYRYINSKHLMAESSWNTDSIQFTLYIVQSKNYQVN